MISRLWERIPRKRLFIVSLIGAAAAVLIVCGILRSRNADMVRKKTEAWMSGDIDDLCGKESAEVSFSQEYLDSLEYLRSHYGDLSEQEEKPDGPSLLASVLPYTKMEVSLPAWISFPLDTELTVTGPDLEKLLQDADSAGTKDAETLRKEVIHALETGSCSVRTVSVPVTLKEAGGVLTAEPSADAVGAIYGSLPERYAQSFENALETLLQAGEGQVTENG